MVSGPGLWTTFFYYFAMMMLIGSFTASRATHSAWLSPSAIQIGVLLGAIAGLGGTYFNRSTTLELPIQGQKVFSNRLEQALESLGYAPVEGEDVDRLTQIYARGGSGSLFAGRLYVQIQDETARIVGRSSAIRRLQSLL